MDVGKPRRVYRVEPLKHPVPRKRERVERSPEKVAPAREPSRAR
jgi:hypothetical protein